MPGFTNHPDATRANDLLHRLRDFLSQALLNLQAFTIRGILLNPLTFVSGR
jgi:hypothetical protein